MLRSERRTFLSVPSTILVKFIATIYGFGNELAALSLQWLPRFLRERPCCRPLLNLLEKLWQNRDLLNHFDCYTKA